MKFKNTKIADLIGSILDSKMQCVFNPIFLSERAQFGKKYDLYQLFRLLRRILKQFRINMSRLTGGLNRLFLFIQPSFFNQKAAFTSFLELLPSDLIDFANPL